MKKLIFIGLLLLFNACGDTQEVLMIKGGTLASCPSKTIEQMVDGYMDLPIWEDLIAEDEKKYVNISGGIMYADKPVEAALQFKINQDETFEYNALEFNGVVQNNFIAMGLLSSMCEEGSGSNSEQSSSLEDPDYLSELVEITVTKEMYKKIETGMTYQEVVAIMGAEGEETINSGSMIIYMWANPDGTSLNATFMDGKVEAKAQFGLQ
jgi:hypothetical protein